MRRVLAIVAVLALAAGCSSSAEDGTSKNDPAATESPSRSSEPSPSPSPSPTAVPSPSGETATRYGTEGELAGALAEALEQEPTCVDAALDVTCAFGDLIVAVDAQPIDPTGQAVGDYLEPVVTSFLVESVTESRAQALLVGPGWFAKLSSLSAQVDQPDLDELAERLADDLGAFGVYDPDDQDTFFDSVDRMRNWVEYDGPSVEIG